MPNSVPFSFVVGRSNWVQLPPPLPERNTAASRPLLPTMAAYTLLLVPTASSMLGAVSFMNESTVALLTFVQFAPESLDL